jgi:DNA-binding NarL/FixJ family response regulator
MSGTGGIRVLCVDDHPLMREGIAAIIKSQPDMQLIGEAATGKEGLEKYRNLLPDVTLMDLRLPDMSGVDCLRDIRAEFPDARIIMVTTFEGDVDVQRALEAGALSYLLKSMPYKEVVDAIRKVHSGKKSIPPALATRLAEHLADEALTSREVEILRCVAEGYRNREIAERLFISEDTVKIHVKHVMDKLGAAHRTQAVTIAIRRGIIQV